MLFLQRIGTFLQGVAQTNMPKKLLIMAGKIFKGEKIGRNIACLTLSIAGGAGGTATFLLVPEINSYFGQVVYSLIPITGIVTDVGVGIIGFWLGGAFCYQLAKYSYREFAQVIGEHTNCNYHLTEADLQRIVDQNPDLYPYKRNEVHDIVDLTEINKRSDDIAQLRVTLHAVRNKIDEVRPNKKQSRDSEIHKKYKRAFLDAKKHQNLASLTKLALSERAAALANIALNCNMSRYLGNPLEDQLNTMMQNLSLNAPSHSANANMLEESEEVEVQVENDIEALPDANANTLLFKHHLRHVKKKAPKESFLNRYGPLNLHELSTLKKALPGSIRKDLAALNVAHELIPGSKPIREKFINFKIN